MARVNLMKQQPPPDQICYRVVHSASNCYHRMDCAYQGQISPQRLIAMVASHSPTIDQAWHTSTRTTHHITSDLTNLSFSSEYRGDDQIQVGNG